MRIMLKEPELELEVNKVDTPTGAGWCIIMPGERKILIKFNNGKWETADDISTHFLHEIGDGINQLLEADKRNDMIRCRGLNPRPKRARIVKYLLI